jgi:teichuronic acid biosynthesis glycosyltransferase TuaC
VTARPIPILTFTTLFPNAARVSHGIFVANRLEKLVASGAVKAHVIAPVPWRPAFFDLGGLGRLDSIPLRTTYKGLTVEHPRYPLIPKFGMTLAPSALYHAGKKAISRLLNMGYKISLIDAHYFYPDGVAAVRLGQTFGLPVVVTARGSDLSLIPQFGGPRRAIQHAAARAAGLITVCNALKDQLVTLGVPPECVTVLSNGVDLERFRPIDRNVARRKLNLTRRTLLSVGLLIERKGHHHAIEALRYLPQTDLLVAGQGPELGPLQQLARRLKVDDRVRFLGNLDSGQLRDTYNAADALILASSREGWANVLLEAMACGTPVVASAVWGTPEVVACPDAGILMQDLSAKGVAEAVNRLFALAPSREATRAYAEKFSWDATTRGQIELFGKILAAPRLGSPEKFQVAFQH